MQYFAFIAMGGGGGGGGEERNFLPPGLASAMNKNNTIKF